MKNIYIMQDECDDLSFIGYKDQLDVYLKDGSIKQGDIIYVVREKFTAIEKKKILLAKVSQ